MCFWMRTAGISNAKNKGNTALTSLPKRKRKMFLSLRWNYFPPPAMLCCLVSWRRTTKDTAGRKVSQFPWLLCPPPPQNCHWGGASHPFPLQDFLWSLQSSSSHQRDDREMCCYCQQHMEKAPSASSSAATNVALSAPLSPKGLGTSRGNKVRSDGRLQTGGRFIGQHGNRGRKQMHWTQ